MAFLRRVVPLNGGNCRRTLPIAMERLACDMAPGAQPHRRMGKGKGGGGGYQMPPNVTILPATEVMEETYIFSKTTYLWYNRLYGHGGASSTIIHISSLRMEYEILWYIGREIWPKGTIRYGNMQICHFLLDMTKDHDFVVLISFSR